MKLQFIGLSFVIALVASTSSEPKDLASLGGRYSGALATRSDATVYPKRMASALTRRITRRTQTNENEPDENEPDENEPDENEPDENEPDENEPDENEPDENEPDENEPDENEPEEPKHDEHAKRKRRYIDLTRRTSGGDGGMQSLKVPDSMQSIQASNSMLSPQGSGGQTAQGHATLPSSTFKRDVAKERKRSITLTRRLGGTEPDENEPDENEPDENDPDENEPDENEPKENEPDENEPEEPKHDEHAKRKRRYIALTRREKDENEKDENEKDEK